MRSSRKNLLCISSCKPEPRLSPASGSRRLLVTMVALRELQRCVMMDVTVSSTQSVIRLRAQIVQHQDLGIQRRAIRFLDRIGSRRLIVAAADMIEQSLEIEKETLEAARQQAPQRRHCQVRFPRSRRARETRGRASERAGYSRT